MDSDKYMLYCREMTIAPVAAMISVAVIGRATSQTTVCILVELLYCRLFVDRQLSDEETEADEGVGEEKVQEGDENEKEEEEGEEEEV